MCHILLLSEELVESYRNQIDRSALPSAPRAARGVDVDFSKVPDKAPFKCFMGNLPFDVTDENIHNFFTGLPVSNDRLSNIFMPQFVRYRWTLLYYICCVTDVLCLLQIVGIKMMSENGRAKGYGYVEFEDRASLIEALSFNEKVHNYPARNNDCNKRVMRVLKAMFIASSPHLLSSTPPFFLPDPLPTFFQ